MARRHSGRPADSARLHGLEIVAGAVVAQAVKGMAKNLCPDRERATIAIGAAMVAHAIPSAPDQIGAIDACGLIGWGLWRSGSQPRHEGSPTAQLPRPWSVAALVTFFALLIGLPMLAFLLLAAPPLLVVMFGAIAATIVAGIPAING
jgi:chromate transporter